MQAPQEPAARPKKKHKNSTVCLLCGREGHYGSHTSCHAANQAVINGSLDQ